MDSRPCPSFYPRHPTPRPVDYPQKTPTPLFSPEKQSSNQHNEINRFQFRGNDAFSNSKLRHHAPCTFVQRQRLMHRIWVPADHRLWRKTSTGVAECPHRQPIRVSNSPLAEAMRDHRACLYARSEPSLIARMPPCGHDTHGETHAHGAGGTLVPTTMPFANAPPAVGGQGGWLGRPMCYNRGLPERWMSGLSRTPGKRV